jgi:hypothetical protein
MHPHTFYASHFDRNKRNEVFVIMSFDSQFDARWTNVLEPAIEVDLGMTANRVDYNWSGESVLHDILDGIANARLVIADITSVPMTDSGGTPWPQRNGNVMWELGVAHAMRLPDEVIIVRSDSDKSIFDLTQFRAFEYDPNDLVAARSVINQLASDRLKSVEQYKSRKVKEAIESLDADSLKLILSNEKNRFFSIPRPKNMREVMEENAAGTKQAMRHLLTLGILKCDIQVVNNAYAYHWTDFGLAVIAALKA